jgi:phosphatidylglycerophosphate synthase
VSKSAAKSQLPSRLLVVILGVLLLTHLVRRAGPAKLLDSLAALGWGIGLVIVLGGLSHLVKTWAWRITLLDERHQVSFARMFGLRLASEAVGQLGGLGQFFGETLRVTLMDSTLSAATRITSVTLDRALFVLSSAVVSAAGMMAVLAYLPLPHNFPLYAGLFAFAVLALIVLTVLAVRKRWAVLSGPAQVLGRVGHFSGWMERQRSLIQSIENKLLDFCHHTPAAFWVSFALNLACHGLAVLEVYLTLWLMGAKVSLFTALAIEALTKLVNLVGVFNPGNIGTYEGGNMLIAKLLGLDETTGLTLAFIRRIRALFWAAIGVICMIVLSKSKKTSACAQLPAAAPRFQKSLKSVAPGRQCGSAGRSHVAVILATNLHGHGRCMSTLPAVGAVPVLLRVILGAQRAGAGRIVVVVDWITGSLVRSGLLSTRRLPASVEWCEFYAGETSLPSLLVQLVDGDERLVLMAGDRTYHPSLHRRAASWSGDGDALALTTGSSLACIYALHGARMLDLAERCPSNINTLEELHGWLTSTHSVECEKIPEDMWQRIHTPQDILSAEEKLDHWLVKPTDGIFARMNRKISIPISRQAIRFPITPNVVSLFTLGVSFLAGLFYAFGGYGNMVLGALLSVFASILDGCDGEVARLKMQESDFGCWLDSTCDALYYVFVFAGMTIGLLRSSGLRVYLVWGGLLLFGAVASLLTTSLQRRRLAAGRPEQYLKIWQTQAERRQSNPLIYLARHTEFIIRRCFLPYALLFFAIFDITNVAFILAAVGSNLVWPIALYSHWTFRAVQPSTSARPAAPAQCPDC